MKINKVHSVYFSPTGGTKNIVKSIAKYIDVRISVDAGVDVATEDINFTRPANRQKVYEFGENDLVVIGSPVYAGRVPNKIAPDFIKCFKGNNTPAILINAYGNRSYDAAPLEMRHIFMDAGFKVIAQAAISNRHVFSDHKLAEHRPDNADTYEIIKFFDNTIDNILKDDYSTVAHDANEEIPPYYIPLGEDGKPVNFLKAKPVTDEKLCDNCKACARNCPMGSIDEDDVTSVPGVCIKCQACVRICHTDAKSFVDEQFLSHVKMLENNYIRFANNGLWDAHGSAHMVLGELYYD